VLNILSVLRLRLENYFGNRVLIFLPSFSRKKSFALIVVIFLIIKKLIGISQSVLNVLKAE
jgi:hypothetical protein